NSKTAQALTKLIDRYHKMSKTDFIAKVDAALSASEKKAGLTEKLLVILEAKKFTDLPQAAQQSKPGLELASVLADLKSLGLHHARFDPSLMRGFDYYTGIVFEVFDLDPINNRSILGGGRYDGLVG